MPRALTPERPLPAIGAGGVTNAVVRLLDRVAAAARRDPAELFQVRFIAGGSLLGLAVALATLAVGAAVGNQVVTVAAFSVYLGCVLLGCRHGVRIQLLIWATLLGLTAFLFLESIVTIALQPQQLAWLVLLPQVSLVLVVPRSNASDAPASRSPVVLASLLALAVGVAIILAHRYGVTFGRHELPPGEALAFFDFATLLVSVTGMMWLYDLTRRATEREILALRRLLSVCAWCKNIRDSEQGWITLEQYMSRHQTPALSHGICPTCMAQHFPDEPSA